MELIKLRNLILARFRTQVNFAATLGISESKLSRVIHGNRKINAKEQRYWAKILNHSRKELFENKTILTSHK